METKGPIIGVIPARYASTRLPFKLSRLLRGKPLLQWTWENASKARSLDQLMIATDHSELKDLAVDFGAEVISTSFEHSSGTDRVAETVRDIEAQLIVNIQADEPLMHPSIIDSLVHQMLTDSDTVMATVKKKIEDNAEIENPGVVKVICDKNGYAVYFSRFPIPYWRNHNTQKTFYKHLGIYAYTKDFLFTFKNLPVSYLEEAEKLEQLRALEAGYKIKVIETQFDSLGVDTQEDFDQVERILSEKGV